MFIWPLEVRIKARSIKSNIDKIDCAISSTKTELDGIANDLTIEFKGAAWRSVRSYTENIIRPLVKVYGSWQIEYARAVEIYSIEASRLPNIGFIHREKFEEYIDKWEAAIDREFNRKHVNMRRISRLRWNISKYRGYIDAMERFAVNTEGIFDECKRLEDIILDTKTGLSTVKFDTEAGEIYFTELSANLINSLNLESNRYDLLKGGLTYKEINELCRLGFGLPELHSMYISMKTCGEEDFVINLARKDFDKAFLKVPQGDGTRLFLSEYFVKLNVTDGDNEFLRALNIMLKPITDYKDQRYHMYQDIYTNSNARAREYIDILYSVTELLLQKNCGEILYGNVDDATVYSNIVERNNRLIGLTTLYGSIKCLIDERYKNLPDKTSVQLPELYISEFMYHKEHKEYSYYLNYSEQILGANYSGNVLSPVKELKSLYVRTDIIDDGSEVIDEMRIDEYKDIQSEKDRLKDRFVKEIIASTLLESFSPVFPLETSIINAVVEGGLGNYSDSAFYDREVGINVVRSMGVANENNVFTKWQAGAGQRSISKYLSFLDKIKVLEEREKKLDEDTMADYFYSGGMYTVDGDESRLVVAGVYNPETNRKIRIVNDKGYSGLLNLEYGIKNPMELGGTKKERELFLNEIGYYNTPETNANKLLQSENDNKISGYELWNGGCDILADPKGFLEESKKIEYMYNNLISNKISFKQLFQN